MPRKPEPVTATPQAPYEPGRPTLIALALLSAWVVALCLPMFVGWFLVGPHSDQIYTGVPFRWFGAEEFRRTGGIPLWNPYMFGGLPFVGAMHGDIFYPTAWLRFALPVDTAMNLGFALHLVLAGVFTYLFLRSLDVSWTGAVTGGVAYQLSGIVASLVQPGHDGKLYVSALLPLILTCLVLAIRKRRTGAYGLLALVVGFGILTPHIQMMQYTLVFAGLFALYLALFAEGRPGTPRQRAQALGLALAAVALGFGIAMIQLYPFVEYMPFAARSAGAQGWEYATSYAMPPQNIVDWVVPEFTGILRSYWGSNFFKLHSEYVGAAALVLAAVGVASPARRRLVWFVLASGALFLLVCLGANTPFYRLWYAVVPGVKVTRAPGMAFFIPTFLFAVLAGFGVERLQKGEGRRVVVGAFVAAAVLLLMGASGALGNLAESLALPGREGIAAQNANAIALGAARSALFAAGIAGLALAALSGRLRSLPLALALAAVVGGDLFVNARRFFTWSPPASELYRDDPVTARILRTEPPYRVLDLPDENGRYPTAFLMGKRIPNLLGHHGNEMHAFDEVMGGKNIWNNVSRAAVLDLFAVRYILMPVPMRIGGFHLAMDGAVTVMGQEAYLYERDSVPSYARVIPRAVKVSEAQAVPTLMDPRMEYDLVLLLPEDAPVDTPELDSLPAPSPSRASVTHWEPGAMTIRLDPAPDSLAFLVVAENWHPGWHATVDGRPAQVLRGHHTLISVVLPAGAREVELRFTSAAYRKGRAISAAAGAGALLWLLVPAALRRRRG